VPDEIAPPSGRTQRSLTESDVRAAAATLVAAFRATDTDVYFASFREDATFVFHTEAQRLNSRAEYEGLWRSWLGDGWRVIDCVSSDATIQLLGSAAIFTHDVRTTTSTEGVIGTTSERETIVFQRADDGGILAVHEHLGPAPTSPTTLSDIGARTPTHTMEESTS
jgi:ketosteroid isomerase-like protein